MTEEQTAPLFNTGVLPKSDDYYRAKGVEEMNGHFLMFNKMLDTLNANLSQDLIKQFHYELKSGVFEDRANGYAIRDYKKRPNMVCINKTAIPSQVPEEMNKNHSCGNTAISPKANRSGASFYLILFFTTKNNNKMGNQNINH